MADVASVVKSVGANAEKWTKTSDSEKLKYLEEIRENLDSVIDEWADLGNMARKYADAPNMHGTAYLVGPALFGLHLNALIDCYKSLVATGKPPKGRERKVGDRTVVETYPNNTLDKLFYPMTVDLWIEPGKEASQGGVRKKTGLVALLGPGNYEGPNDILTTLFTHSQVGIYSPHPNLAGSTRMGKKIFKPLVDAGFLAFLPEHEDPGVMRTNAQKLMNSEEVVEVLMTGGCATYDNIVWGGPEGKKAGKKAMNKPMSAELGACSPYIICPGEWSESELNHHAGMLAGAKLMNSSAVCASPQVLMVQKEWPQREAFIKKYQDKMKSAKDSGKYPVFYPGTEDRTAAAKAAYPADKVIDIDIGPGGLKPVLLRLEESDMGSYATTNEFFAPVLAELPISAKSPKEFLEKAQEYANSDKVFGSLSASVFIPDKVRKELGQSFMDDWVTKMEWGSVGINDWAAMSCFMGPSSWGAYPKHSPEDIQSGMGKANNYFMYDNVQKAVLNVPFICPVHPKGPATLDDAATAKKMAYFTVKPSYGRLMPLLACALGGRNGPTIGAAVLGGIGAISAYFLASSMF